MKIQLLNTTVDKFEFNRAEIDEDDFGFEFSPAFTEEPGDTFIIRFTVNFKSKEHYHFKLVYVAEFKTDKIIERDFIDGPFPAVNAPAIAFPFLRAFISMFTLNAGFDAVMLPSINFQAAYNARKDELTEK